MPDYAGILHILHVQELITIISRSSVIIVITITVFLTTLDRQLH